MMMEPLSVGFVLIECKPGSSLKDMENQLDEIDIVKETVRVDGLWRLIVKLEAHNLDAIREAIQWKIRKMTGIESTLTLVEHM
jgi:DNA-binding Lrp family transcriptional regulator